MAKNTAAKGKVDEPRTEAPVSPVQMADKLEEIDLLRWQNLRLRIEALQHESAVLGTSLVSKYGGGEPITLGPNGEIGRPPAP